MAARPSPLCGWCEFRAECPEIQAEDAPTAAARGANLQTEEAQASPAAPEREAEPPAAADGRQLPLL